MQIETLKKIDLNPYEKNARVHPKKQIDLLVRNIKEFGFTTPVLIDDKNNVIAGHGRLVALEAMGIKDVPCVRMSGLTKKQVKALRIADNQIATMGEWDMDLALPELKGMDADLFELTGFDKDLLIEPDEKDDEVPDVPEKPQSKLGDLYELGEHRVLCGDSTKVEDVEKLMDGKKADLVVTDPPYNTGMEGKPNNEKARLSHMFNDKIENWDEFLKDVFALYITNTKGACAFYVFIDWRRVGDMRGEMEKHSDYKSTYELCIVGKKGNPEIHNRYGLDYQDIWRLQREMGRNKDHATAKPVELCEKPIKHASKADDIVLDLFLGSGSTLIAAEKTNRICYGMELDEKYVDVIVQRYVDFSSNTEIKKNGKLETWDKSE